MSFPSPSPRRERDDVGSYRRLKEVLAYPDPTFEEMLELCRDFGLVAEYHVRLDGVQLRCVNQVFDLRIDEAEVLMQGLLLGFFYGHSRDDLSLARWDP
jgi:hypothetical protein